MSRNVLYDVSDLISVVTSSSGFLESFDTNDFSQLVIQATTSGTAGVSGLQVSPDGINWLDTTLSVPAPSPTTAITVVADVAFSHARFRYSNATNGDRLTIRVLGRL